LWNRRGCFRGGRSRTMFAWCWCGSLTLLSVKRSFARQEKTQFCSPGETQFCSTEGKGVEVFRLVAFGWGLVGLSAEMNLVRDFSATRWEKLRFSRRAFAGRRLAVVGGTL